MSHKTTIASAANVLPSALASLRGLGYAVSKTPDGLLCRAENAECVLIAEDLLSLLGLATLRSLRGDAWLPADEEVEELLSFEEG